MSFSISIQPAPESRKEEIKEEYDLVIVGAGPAGCSAGLYAGRFLLNTLIIYEKLGGMIADAWEVDNYPGIQRVSGSELSLKLFEHAKSYGVDALLGVVEEIRKVEDLFHIFAREREREIRARCVIIATGEKRRKLGVPGEDELLGKGVSYCAICDAPLFKEKVVALVGGGNTAFIDAQILARHAKKVILIHRRNWFRADPVNVERAKKTENIEIKTPYIVKKITGKGKVERLILERTEEREGKVFGTGDYNELRVDGIFIDIGLEPNSELARSIGVELDERGYIIVDDEMRTNVPGIFGAGDVTNKGSIFRQAILAAAQGAIAAYSTYNYIRKKF